MPFLMILMFGSGDPDQEKSGIYLGERDLGLRIHYCGRSTLVPAKRNEVLFAPAATLQS